MASSQEIAYVTKACQVTDTIMKKLWGELKKNISTKRFTTEKDVFHFIKKEIYAAKCTLAFRPIVAMAENAYEIHHIANDTKLKRGFLVLDFGARYKGYCADCTRTVFLGEPTIKEKALYCLVLMAELTSLRNVSPGAYAADIDLIARAALWDYFENFVHSTGHGVGKYIHQSPRISPGSRSILKENQIITVEPGLYFKNRLGIRIEDTLVVKQKPVVLTKTSKQLRTIKI